MSLAALFDAAKPVIEAALGRAGFPLPFHELGEEHLPRASHFPAIVWIPTGGPFAPPRQQGAVKAVRAGDAVALVGDKNPNHLWTCKESIKMVLSTGTGYLDTEVMLGAIVAEMAKQLTLWSFRPIGRSWTPAWPVTTEEPVRDAPSGAACVLTFEAEIPLVAEKMQTGQATSATITGEVIT
ncbi:MAG: hypothetical protein V4537_14510 [Pseudomonadota bacterium]